MRGRTDDFEQREQDEPVVALVNVRGVGAEQFVQTVGDFRR